MEEQAIKKQSINIKRKKKGISKKKKLISLLVYEFIVGMIMLIILQYSVSLNSSDDIKYADSSGVDDIRYEGDFLIVNNVTVTVPANENVSYNIAYGWGKEDKEYPTVPKSITASYGSKNGEDLYDISLYKDSFTPSDKIESGRSSENWFNDWENESTDSIKYEKKNIGSLYGFLISSSRAKNITTSSACESMTYYFTVQSPEGISVYVLDGNLYDKSFESVFKEAMQSSMESIITEKQAV